MSGLIWPAAALFVLAILLRSQKRTESIDWRSRGLLLLMSTFICWLLGRWLQTSVLDDADMQMTTGLPSTSFVAKIGAHYEPVLLPVYIGGVTILIDILARLIRRGRRHRSLLRYHEVTRAVCANLLLFVAVPGIPYTWIAASASGGSLLGDAARDAVMPVIALYGAPSYWLMLRWSEAWRPYLHDSDAPWAWNPMYDADTYLSASRFIQDAAPWVAFAILLVGLAMLLNRVETRRVADYFFGPATARSADLVSRLWSTWRGCAAILFTLLWTVPAILSIGLTYLVASFAYVLLWILAFALVGILAALTALVLRVIKSRRH